MTREEADYSDWGQIEEKNENIICVLNKISDEIEQERVGYPPSAEYYKAIVKVLQIIDKYKSESEEV